MRSLESVLGSLLSELKRKYGAPLYFPFEISGGRPLRPLQGYAFKLPREFLALFPELSDLLDAPIQPNRPAATTRNPAWSRDELILALDLYFFNPTSPPSKHSREVIELSRVLNRMGSTLGSGGMVDFRNPNGVYMKMMNFRRFDPEYTSGGRVGLTRGNKEEELVWNEFANDRSHLSKIAAAIRTAIDGADIELSKTPDDDNWMEAPEGRVLTRLHRIRERNRKLVEQRKLKALREQGMLQCEVCSFDFEERYGSRGQGSSRLIIPARWQP